MHANIQEAKKNEISTWIGSAYRSLLFRWINNLKFLIDMKHGKKKLTLKRWLNLQIREKNRRFLLFVSFHLFLLIEIDSSLWNSFLANKYSSPFFHVLEFIFLAFILVFFFFVSFCMFASFIFNHLLIVRRLTLSLSPSLSFCCCCCSISPTFYSDVYLISFLLKFRY